MKSIESSKLVLMAVLILMLLLLSPSLTVTGFAQSIPGNVVLETEVPTAPSEMAVYRVIVSTRSLGSAGATAAAIGMKGDGTESARAFVYESKDGSKSLVAFKSSDSFVYGDYSKWFTDSAAKRLPKEDAALRLARSYLERRKMLPEGAEFVKTAAVVSKVYDEERGTTSSYQNDLEAIFGKRIDGYPVDGMEVRVAFGDSSKVIGVVKKWRDTAFDRSSATVGPLQALERLAVMLDGAKTIVVTNAYIAYYSLPPGEAQEFVEPFYNFEGRVEANDASVGFAVRVPALAEAEVKPPTIQDEGITKDVSALPRNADDWSTYLKIGGESVNNYAGVGLNNLADSNANVANAYNLLISYGAHPDFRFTDSNAWERDFETVEAHGWNQPNYGLDAYYADNVDLMMFSGHGSPLGWYFGSYNPGYYVTYEEVSLGDKNLEWLVVAACQVLQFDSGYGNAFQRWGRAFKGLHHILSYATVSYDSDYELRTFAEALLGFYGRKYTYVEKAWILASMYSQPSSVIGSFMRAYKGISGATNTKNDRPCYLSWKQDLLDPIYYSGKTGQLWWVGWVC
jgi:hypothetical protein